MTLLSGAVADRPAEPGLFAGLIDDAAMFPPGNAALPEAVRLHRLHRASPYAGYVGPLLVPAARAADLVAILEAEDDVDPLRVAVIGRPGTPAADVVAAVRTVHRAPGAVVVGAEMGWSPEWRQAAIDVPLSLEVPRGPEQAKALTDIAADATDSAQLQAKFRTGATSTWAWPDEAELAALIRAVVDHDLGFKLTGGLHHAVRGSYAGEEQHGLLNVLTAVRWALNGEEADELVPLLAERDPAVLISHITRMSAADTAIVRAFFTTYGCCGVTDPISELTTLGLLEGL